MRLTDILDPRCIKVPLTATDKRGAIEELVRAMAECSVVKDPQSLLQAVLDREAIRTTGIGHGLATPHGKSPAVGDLAMAIGKAEHPIDFQSVDSKPVTLVILLASPPDKALPHIQALARISRLMTIEPFRNALEKAANAQEVYDIIARQEDSMTHPTPG